jgi:IPT/TIG domain
VPVGGSVTLAPTNAEPHVQIVYTNPTVTNVKPDAGLERGGARVTLTGTNLATVTEVKFGSAASVPASCSETECQATSPAGSGAVHLTVSTVGATSAPSSANLFTYVPVGPAPTVKRLSAKLGPAVGGTPVTITGSAFTGVTEVRFGPASASDVTVVSSTSITVVSPAGTTGTADVTVITPNGTSALGSKDQFKYEAPVITAVAPNTGSKVGGTRVTVTGGGFAVGTTGTTFDFGGTPAGSVACASSTSCTMVAPAVKKAGAVDVKATVEGKASKKNAPADQFTYGP